MPKISQKFAAAIGPVTADRWFWDDTLKGFAIRARPAGAPAYWVRYSFEGKKRKHLIGPCAVVKAEAARERAREILELARTGKDHNAEARALKGLPTVADLAREHLEVQKPPKIAVKTWRDKKSHWEAHIVPAIGKIRVADLSFQDIEKLHSKYVDQPSLANRMVATLSKALSDCERFRPAWRPVNSNPAYRVKRFEENRRERILSKDELGAVLRRLVAMRDEPSSTWSIPWLVFLLLVTGLRLSELSMRTWSQIDLEEGTLRIPKAKNKKPRIVMLSRVAIDTLREMPKPGAWAFPNSTGEGPFVSPQKHWDVIRQALGINEVRLHDLRHTIASMAMNGAGLSQREVMALLGHSQMVTTERYLNVHSEGLRTISDRASAAIVKNMTRRPLIEAAE